MRGGGVHVFDSMREVLKLHLESESYGSETSFRRNGYNTILAMTMVSPLASSSLLDRTTNTKIINKRYIQYVASRYSMMC